MKNRILFVDDEPNILSSMKRMLRGLRKTVTMDFVESGRDALAAMAAAPYDVVISDMRMPGMDGAELLTSIRDTWPHTIRVMLTGQADSDSLLRTVNVVHKFLMKPCEQDEIKACLERACELYTFLFGGGPGVMATAGFGFESSLPQVYQEVQDLLLTEPCKAASLAECLGGDDWISSRIVELAAIGTQDQEPASIPLVDAVDDLGFEVIRPLVLSLHLFQQLLEERPQDESLVKVLDHGMHVGHYAKRIAQTEKATGAEVLEAFIGGLLHDIGYLVLANRFPEQYEKILLCNLPEDEGDFDGGEEDIFPSPHDKAGASLLVRMGFPLGVIEIVAYHHLQAHDPDRSFAGLTAVHVADAYLVETDKLSWFFRPGINHDYLAQIQCQGRLATWEKILHGQE